MAGLARPHGVRRRVPVISARTRLRSLLRFRRFQSRLLVFFLGLFVLVQAAIFISVNAANIRNARRQIDEALEVTASVFERSLRERNARLVGAARLLVRDHGFKPAYASRDHGTILSALENFQGRIGADVVMLVSLDRVLIADTLHKAKIGSELPFPRLFSAADESERGEAEAVVFLDGRAYQMVVVPLLIPVPDAWICVGFLIDDRLAAELQSVTLSYVSFLKGGREGEWGVLASTLPAGPRARLSSGLREGDRESGRDGDEYVSRVVSLAGDTGGAMTAVLQRSLDEALTPHRRLQAALAAVFVASAVVTVAGGIGIGRTVTKPVLALARRARRIEEGDYSHQEAAERADEIGHLTKTFNHMVKGLAERDRVRDLLGKVVSSAVAEELLSKAIELGGEEREVTILFSDLRDFTGLCEGRSPKDILSLLNAYLTRISAVIDENGGVVDKFVGDAVMALYGAPLRHGDDAERAVRTALGMLEALDGLNAESREGGLPTLSMGIGINTAVVVAGNMGAPTRLNYTVIGDGVNLASRLEGLCKRYGVAVVVSETTRALAPGLEFRELDRVRVKGKSEPVTIYEPLGESDKIDPRILREMEAYNEALALHRARRWDEAVIRFGDLKREFPEGFIYQVYLDRAAEFLQSPPGPDWDGSHTFHEK
ncbi:MAG: adenylate/guanylate cyclase domain-containing protein [Nitrospirota bacterium]